jgi:hypothetical protein
MIKKILGFIKNFLERRRKEKEFKKKLEELRKRDPFIYNH